MRSVLDRALVSVDRELGWGTARGQVRRVEPHRRGGLVVTLESPAGIAWYRVEDDRLERMFPSEERDIPLCRARGDELRADALEVLAWRPGRRIVVREPGPDGHVVKGFRRGRSAAAAARARLVAEAAGDLAGLVSPALVEHDAERDALVFEHLRGERLRVHPVDAEAFQRLGNSLGELRRALPTAGLEPFTWRDELSVLAELRERVARLHGLAPRWDELLEALRSLAPSAGVRPVATHRDLHDGQLLLVDDRVGLLDVDLLCAADPALDAANLTAHLQLRALQRAHGASQRGAEECARAFLVGLDVGEDREALRRLRAYQASTFLRLALLYSIRPRWVDLVTPLTDLARRAALEAAHA